MTCAWKELLAILPPRLRREVNTLGKDRLQELRLRIGAPPELVLGRENRYLAEPVTREDVDFVINAASRYSPWAAATISQGYLTAPGGHRIGICGEAVCKQGTITTMREIRFLCIRIARDFPDWGRDAAGLPGNLLIIGAPGWGKTTLLRCLSRRLAEKAKAANIPVVLIGGLDEEDSGDVDFDMVMHNDRERAMISMAHLLDLGHRRIKV